MSIYQLILICLIFFGVNQSAFPEDLSDRVSEELESVKIGSHDIDISNWRGEVTLKGTINSQQDKARVIDTVNSVEGVDRIIDLLRVTGNAEFDNREFSGAETDSLSQIKNGTESFLQKLKLKGPHLLEYQAVADKVVIGGQLPAGTNKQALQNYWINNFNFEIQDKVMVRAWPSDSDLKQRLQDELSGKQGLDLVGIGINVDQGVVTLTGKRANHFEADQLATAVWMVEGVRDFKSEITYEGSRDDPMSVINKTR